MVWCKHRQQGRLALEIKVLVEVASPAGRFCFRRPWGGFSGAVTFWARGGGGTTTSQARERSFYRGNITNKHCPRLDYQNQATDVMIDARAQPARRRVASIVRALYEPTTSWPARSSFAVCRPQPAAPGTPLGLLEVLIPQPEHVGAALPRGRPEQKAAQRIPPHGAERVSRASGRAHHGEPVHPSRASRSSQAAGTDLANAGRQRRGGVSHNIVWL